MTAEIERGATTVAAEIYDAIQRGDYPAVAARLSPDVELVEAEGHPLPGRWSGRDQVLAALPEVMARVGMTGMTVERVVGDAERAVGLIELHLTDRDGVSFMMPVAEVWTVVDGLVTSVRPYYFDTKVVADRCG